jgi:hypothetical protein
MSVDPAHIKDTADLFYMQNQRKISLRYLAWYFLNMDVQVGSMQHANCRFSLESTYVLSARLTFWLLACVLLRAVCVRTCALAICTQAGNHDSIEDSRAALHLYRKYQQVRTSARTLAPTACRACSRCRRCGCLRARVVCVDREGRGASLVPCSPRGLAQPRQRRRPAPKY